MSELSTALLRRLEALDVQLGKDAPSDWPHVPQALVEFLEGEFPPRCLNVNEAVEDHLRYAGASDLVVTLRWHLDKQQGPDAEPDVDDEVSVEVKL